MSRPKKVTRTLILLSLVAMLVLDLNPARAQGHDSLSARASALAPTAALSHLMDRDKEFQMAVISAPPEIRDSSGVYVLEEHGFIKVRDSRNGFNCIVERRAKHLSPMCYDAVGSTSTLQATLMRGDLLMKGTDPVEIEKRIDEAYRDGHLHAPQKAGIVYMLSTEENWHDQSSGGVTVHIVPHIMVYAPYLKNSDIDVAKEQVWKTNHVWIQYEGRPDAYLIFSVGSTWAQP